MDPKQRFLRILLPAFYIATMATHALVIGKIIPYQWVNGGMSTSYQAQAIQSSISLVVIALLALFIWNMRNQRTKLSIWQNRFLYVITGLWIIGFMLQLLGTPFERYILSVVMLIGIVGHLRLVRSLSRNR